MVRWIPYAFVRISLFFMLGIWAAVYNPGIIELSHLIVGFSFLIAVYGLTTVCYWQKRFKLYGTQLKFVAGLVGLSAVFLGGFINVLICTDTRKDDHLINLKDPVRFSKVVVTSGAVEKTNSWKLEASVEAVRTENNWQNAEGKILLYFPKKDFSDAYAYGDVLILKGTPQRIAAPANPEEFDYQRFMAFKNVYHQQFVRKDDVKLLGSQPSSWIDNYALICRTWADNALKKNISGQREQGLVSALVLGVTDGLDNELLSAYKATGTMHILAVSGLHVAIVYGLVLLILRPFNKLKYGPWVVAAVSIIVLWTYAFITGLSPSVLRAVTMFSFVALAKPTGQRTNIYNTLAASAFCILLYDPYLLMSVGFQLSYLAVLGIVYIQPLLYNLWEPSHRWIDEIWKISSVSIAAQLATFSLGLFYFHQFPNYFLLSNLIVIPASFVVLILGLAVLALGFIQPVGIALGFILEWIIKILNVIVFAIEDFPFSLIENLYITPLQCWLLIGILVAILLLIETRRFKWAITTASFVVVFSFVQWHHFQSDVNIQKITVYNIPGHSAVEFTDCGRAYFVADSVLMANSDKIGFHILPHRVKLGVFNAVKFGDNLQRTFNGCRLMTWKGKSFLQVYDPSYILPDNIKVDFVIISNNAVTDIKKLNDHIRMDRLILDSSNSKSFGSKLLKQTAAFQLNVHSVIHQGAFEYLI